MTISIDSPSHPLYGIDDLNWSQWQTAYGDATDVPENLKRLVYLKSEKAKKNALFQIRVSVYHQGYNYSSIPATLEYLIRIFKMGNVSSGLELALFRLITELGRFDLFTGRWIACGIPDTTEAINSALSPYFDFGEWPIFHQAFKKMDDLRDDCLEKLRTHKNPNFRCQCLHLLMCLQNDRESIIVTLQNQYPLEKNSVVRLSIIWAIAFLGMHLSQDQQQKIREWVKLNKPRIYRGLMSHMFTVAELYLGNFTPEIQNQIITMIKDDYEYPILLDTNSPPDLVLIALSISHIKYQLSENDFDFLKFVFKTHYSICLNHGKKSYKEWRSDLLVEILIGLSFTEPIGLHHYWWDHSLEEQRLLFSKLSNRQVDTLSFLCLHPVWRNHKTENLLRKCKLPESYEELALFLGWLPEFDYWKNRDIYLKKSQIDQFPELKPIIDYRGLTPFIENFFPLSNNQLDNFSSLFNWKNISTNSSINFTPDIIRQHQDMWDWGTLSNNAAIHWNVAVLSEFSDKVYWPAISARSNLPWDQCFIEKFIDFWNWSNLSLNQSLPWSAELIAGFSEHWDWQDLSSNSALPWNAELLNQFSSKWDWEELSENEALPWSEYFFNQFSKHWWRYKDALAINSKIPWTEDLLKKFDDFHWEYYLSKNNGLPWSELFIEKYQEKIDWYNFSKVTRFNWTEDFIEQHKDNLGFAHLAENPSLPWSANLISRYKDKWNWYVLSKNPALPWSATLLEEFEDHWDWGTIPYNQNIPWTKESITILKRHKRKIPRIRNQNFPWTLELINEPAFAYVFDSDDCSLYSRVIAPLLNPDNVTRLLNAHRDLLEKQKASRREHFIQHGPDIAADHLLHKVLNIN